MIGDTARDLRDTAMEILTKESFREARLMVLEFIDGIMGKRTKANGLMDSNKGKELGEVSLF
jgi:hypothetical protein